MKPITQTKFGREGNCLMSSIASILEIELEDCPDVFVDDSNPMWFSTIRQWLFSRGIRMRSYHDLANPPQGYHVAHGNGPRGWDHACVALDGEIVHDPHPDRTGLVQVRGYFILEAV
jgi:hypothetical protein